MHSDHVDTAVNDIRKIFEDVSSFIEEMKSGEKIPATQLAAKFAEKYNLKGPDLYPTLRFLLRNYPGIQVKRGATGGVYKL